MPSLLPGPQKDDEQGDAMKHFKMMIVPLSGDPVVQDIDDCDQVYGDNIIQMFPETFEPCPSPLSTTGQHAYDALREPERCIYCGRVT